MMLLLSLTLFTIIGNVYGMADLLEIPQADTGCQAAELLEFQSTFTSCIQAVAPSRMMGNPILDMMNLLTFSNCLADKFLGTYTVSNKTRTKREAGKEKGSMVTALKVTKCSDHCLMYWLSEIAPENGCQEEHFTACFEDCLEHPNGAGKKFPKQKECKDLEYDDPHGCVDKCKKEKTGTGPTAREINMVKYKACFEKCYLSGEKREKRYLGFHAGFFTQAVEVHTTLQFTQCYNPCLMGWLMGFSVPRKSACHNPLTMQFLFCYIDCLISVGRGGQAHDHSWKWPIIGGPPTDTIVPKVKYVDCYVDCLIFHNELHSTVNRTDLLDHPETCVAEDFVRSAECSANCLMQERKTKDINLYHYPDVIVFGKLKMNQCIGDCWLEANVAEVCLLEELLNLNQCVNDCLFTHLRRPKGVVTAPGLPIL